MIRPCRSSEFETILSIINDAALAYKGVIPADCWKEPYMSRDELRHEINTGVIFWGYEEKGELVGVMGIQHVHDITLIRHAYVLTARRNKGTGSKLLSFLRGQTTSPILIGTWADAVWQSVFMKNTVLVLFQEKIRTGC